MLSPGDDESFEASLPESTSTPSSDSPEPIKRKRRTKAEMQSAAEPDALMSDPLYRSAIEDMTGFGGPDLIDFVCTVSGKPMDNEETRKVKGVFYVAGKRANIDPGQSWMALIIYAVAVFAKLLLARTGAGESLKTFFASLSTPPPAPPAPKSDDAERPMTEASDFL